MGNIIRVASFNEMEQASKKLISHSETYTTIYKQLLQESETMGAAWEGSDNLAYVEQIQGFTKELQMMAEKLRRAGETLNKQRQNYVSRQESNIAQVKKLTN